MCFLFCSGKSVGSDDKSVGSGSVVGSGNFFLSGIESLGDIVLLFVFVPRGVESKVGQLIESFCRPKYLSTTLSLLVSKSLFKL